MTKIRQLTAFGILGMALAGNLAQAQIQVIQPPSERPITKQEALARYSGDLAPQTREGLRRLLEGYPPSFVQVLQLDPTLLTNPEYLKPYPQLSQFLQEHPEVAHNPNYFLGSPDYPYNRYENRRDGPIEDFLEGMFAFVVFAAVTGALFWLVRTFVNHRRWLRLSRLQTEANTRLMDRFTSNEDLLNFIQTPAGSRFLESSAVPVEPRAIGAPISRILWSSQIGLVLFAMGAGFELLSARVDTAAAGLEPGVDVMFHAFGILALAAGIGFILSGVLSYALSQKLGLI